MCYNEEMTLSIKKSCKIAIKSRPRAATDIRIFDSRGCWHSFVIDEFAIGLIKVTKENVSLELFYAQADAPPALLTDGTK